jgi:hypothetical protein
VTQGTGASASFVALDTTTQGNWKAQYGSDGYLIVGDATALPADTQLAAAGQAAYTWASATSDPRALERAGGGRTMSAWYGGTFTIDVTVGGTQPRQVALYSADFDPWGR